MRRRVSILASAIALAVVALAGCSSPTTNGATEPPVEPTNPYGGFPIDPPADDEVVLTVVGDQSVDFTYAELKDRSTVDVTIVEPFVDRTETFSGVPFADLVASAGIADDATVSTVALNGYVYDDTAAALIGADALVAVLRDGEPIPMDEGGPIRLVFATDSTYYEFLDAWNWSLRSIERVDPAP